MLSCLVTLTLRQGRSDRQNFPSQKLEYSQYVPVVITFGTMVIYDNVLRMMLYLFLHDLDLISRSQQLCIVNAVKNLFLSKHFFLPSLRFDMLIPYVRTFKDASCL